jgi:hypothetical protein
VFQSHAHLPQPSLPSDFFLVGYVKHSLEGLAFSLHTELVAAILQVLTDIPVENLYASFEHMMSSTFSMFPFEIFPKAPAGFNGDLGFSNVSHVAWSQK